MNAHVVIDHQRSPIRTRAITLTLTFQQLQSLHKRRKGRPMGGFETAQICFALQEFTVDESRPNPPHV